MALNLVLECRQCAGPIELRETDHLVSCPYCNVSTFLAGSDYFRLTLPARPQFRDLIQVPYLHFRGSIYSCTEKGVGFRIADLSRPGVELPFLPRSLSVRSQVLKMRFAVPAPQTSFLANRLSVPAMLDRVGRSLAPAAGNLYHQAMIGEAVQLIYLPLARQGGQVFDAVAGTPLFRLPPAEDPFEPLRERNPAWRLHQLATLCPHCGGNLEGARDSNVLYCRNCLSAWWPRDGRFTPLSFGLTAGKSKEVLYLPFWQIEATGSPLPLSSYADFIRLTNQPRVLQPGWEQRPLHFWAPAFKIRPDQYLRLATQLTLAQPEFASRVALPPGPLPSVTLPQSEAIQSLIPILAASAIKRLPLYPLLPELAFAIRGIRLHLLPFLTSGYELAQEQTGILINRRALELGRAL